VVSKKMEEEFNKVSSVVKNVKKEEPMELMTKSKVKE
jgi:hypothetical protein